jgi:DNA polymerase III psi subunit
MSLAAEQLYALQEMGIPVWQLRDHPEQIEPVDLSNCETVIVCEHFEPGSPQHHLLTAILNALHIDIATVARMSIQQAQHQLGELALKSVICFGEETKAGLAEQTAVSLKFVTASLSTLLAKPQLKAEAWNILSNNDY